MKKYTFEIVLAKDIDFPNGQKGNSITGTIGGPNMQTATILLLGQIAAIPADVAKLTIVENTSPIILPGNRG